jgi:excisionase family DNA binding protein
VSDIDWTWIRGVPWEDDPLDRAELAAEIERLRCRLTQRSASNDRTAEPASLLHAEIRRLAASVEMMRAALPPLLVTMDVAAETLGVSLSTIRRMISAGDLPSRRLGRSVRVDLSACKGLDGNDIARLAREARASR